MLGASCAPGTALATAATSSAIFAVVIACLSTLHAALLAGNTMKATMSLYEGTIKLRDLLKNWAVSWTGNFIGSLAVLAVVLATGLIPAGTAAPIKVALAKTSLTFTQVGCCELCAGLPCGNGAQWSSISDEAAIVAAAGCC
jgi:formate/nitrite transporter FocA (FNT family)